MPTYEYECESCGHDWEVFQKMTAQAVKKCPKCKKSKARRLLSSGAGFLFKGSGFHTTDYRSESYKKAASSESKSSAPPEKPAADKSTTDKKTPAKKK